jgi:hypothetical protein
VQEAEAIMIRDDELAKLDALRKSGVLTEEEFWSAKRKLFSTGGVVAPPRTPVAASVAPSKPRAAPSAPKKRRKKLSPAARISWVVLAVVVLVVVVVQVIISSSSAPSPKFSATATATQVFSPTSLGVGFNVENVGKGSGAPSCTVTAAATASEGGVNIVTLPTIGSGHWDYESTSADRVSISGGAASQVDINNGGVSITCK